MTERHKRPNVVTETTVFEPSIDDMLSIFLECGRSIVAYESLFRETRVTGTLILEAWLGAGQGTFTVTVESYNQPPVAFTIASDDPNPSVSVTVDSLERITFSCSGSSSSGGPCAWGGWYYLTLHWCKSC